MIAELLNQYIFENFGMLVEQGLDIGIGCLDRRFATTHRSDAHGSAAMVFRIEGQHLFIGLNRGVDIARLLQRQRLVIGFRQRVFVDLLLCHGYRPFLLSRRH